MPRMGIAARAVLGIAILAGFLVVPAQAVPVLRFDQVVDVGTLFYNGTGGALVGTHIGFDTITTTGAPLNNGTTGCLGCFLDFHTGTNTGEGPINWTWNGGGTFTIRGQVPAANINTDTDLLTGTFTLASALGTGNLFIFSGFGVDTKDGALLSYYGLSPGEFEYAATVISETARINSSTGRVSADVDEADVTNTSVPEPSSMLLFLIGLGSLAAYRFRPS